MLETVHPEGAPPEDELPDEEVPELELPDHELLLQELLELPLAPPVQSAQHRGATAAAPAAKRTTPRLTERRMPATGLESAVLL
jgi:hypothetical protein